MADFRTLTPFLSVSGQLDTADLGRVAAQGYHAVINCRPDGEADDQPSSAALKEAAEGLGLTYRHLPVTSGRVTDDDVSAYTKLVEELRGPVLSICRTGTRSATLWALSHADHLDPDAILQTARTAGYDLGALRRRLEQRWGGTIATLPGGGRPDYDVVIVGGGAAGLASAASIHRRAPELSIAVIEPRDKHYYQPGWTLVGGGAFDRAKTERDMASVMPGYVRWLRTAAAEFRPEQNQVVLEDGETVGYRALVVAPGLKLDWDSIEGARESLGRNGVTSNYRFDLSAYTWELVQGLKGGKAVFTQPPMPIKCAGAPQKALYLSCDYWRRQGVLKDIDVEFCNAGGVLFGVKEFVPSLMRYVERYGADLTFNTNLTAVDGAAQRATFTRQREDGTAETIVRDFDFLHVVPPQTAPDFIRQSPLANAAGWVEVDSETLRHTRYGNIFGVGDVVSAPNAKTAAAVRKQAPIAAHNLVGTLKSGKTTAIYDGYGACPLTVEKGKVVLAEFGYGGKLLPTFPLNPRQPRWINWIMKADLMPWLYWELLLKGKEWLVDYKTLNHAPTPHEVAEACDFETPVAANIEPAARPRVTEAAD